MAKVAEPLVCTKHNTKVWNQRVAKITCFITCIKKKWLDQDQSAY